MSRESTLNNAITEELKRRSASFKEFKMLFDIYIKHIKTTDVTKLKKAVQNKLLELKNLIFQFTSSSQNLQGATYPFKTNKNPKILECAYNFIGNHGFVLSWEELMHIYPMSPNSKTWLKLRNNDHKGTSAMNCVQAALYVTLTEFGATQDIKDAKIYDVTTSPLIQTTALPAETVDQPLYNNFTQSILFYKDELSPEQGELIFFNMGYSFGGSRIDSRYHKKEFRTEDCSSCVAKWISSECALTTYTMKLLFQDQCHEDQCCNHVKTTLKPKGTILKNIAPGDLYVFQKGGHMGIITDIMNNTCFESLTYSRVMPTKEGIGYDVECLTTRDYFFFGHISDNANNDL